MGFRMRRSIKIAPGVRMNIGKKSLGVSVGTKGLRYSVNSRGRRTTTASIPGTGISYSTSSRAYKSSAYSRNSELKKLQRQQDKLEELERSRLEVELFENKIDMIKSIHKECDDFIDWNEIKCRKAPFNKDEVGPKEKEALNNVKNYKPTFLQNLFRKSKRIVEELNNKVNEGRIEDLEDYKCWEELTEIANKICNKDVQAYLDVIESFRPLDDLLEFGSKFEFSMYDTKHLEVVFEVNTNEVVPKQIKTLTKTGKLSIKEMGKTKYYDIQQDYVCSCVIRIARDMFALLPLDYIIIHALDEKLNTSTGMYEKITILSIKIEREILESLNMDLIDPSDAMDNFQYNMKFKKVSGFYKVEKIED